MKVLLINPEPPQARAGKRRYRRAWPPLDLLSAAAVLRDRGCSTEVVDARAAPVSWPDLKQRADSFDMVVLTTSPLDRWQCPDLEWRAMLAPAAVLPRDRLVVTGAHGTVRPETVLLHSRAQTVVRGEPEEALAELAARGPGVAGVAGTSRRQGDRVIHEPDAPQVHLDDLPAPAYDLVQPRWYGYELLGPRLGLVETSRGCPYRCIFCLKAMYGSGVRCKAVDRVLAETSDLIEKWGAQAVYFIDLEFTMQRERTMRLVEGLAGLPVDFSWCCQTRVDAVDPEMLAAMSRAGCRLIHFGIETGAPRLLEETKKKVTVEQAEQAVRWCREAGMETACFFLFGLPGETPADRKTAADLARRLNPSYASFHAAAPYPGAELGDIHGAADDFPSCLDTEHDPARLARDLRRAWLGFYLRPRYLLSRLAESGLSGGLRRLRLFWEFVR